MSEASAAAFARRYQLDPKQILRWAKDLDAPLNPRAVQFHPVRVVDRCDAPTTALRCADHRDRSQSGGEAHPRATESLDRELRQVLDVVAGPSAC
ncbi:MAG: hypothetical protein IPK07_19055 [Deltaproteobacteria bacterium]|nr:hypothetical protein [Deltaproteobacteria bacterium]